MDVIEAAVIHFSSEYAIQHGRIAAAVRIAIAPMAGGEEESPGARCVGG
jgi:hypothetical protein